MRFAPALLVAGLMVSSAAGCGYLDLLPGRTFHQRCGWKAEDYFTDSKVIALCKAIEAKDLAEMGKRKRTGIILDDRPREP